MNKKKNGFTLIELLAVIIILGILMIIAIPSVTRYISDSRKSAYVDTAKEIIGGTRNVVNEGMLEMYSTDTTYYIPSKCIKTENGGEAESPYGKFKQAYIGVIYDGKGYKYYWISVDDAGEGVSKITPLDKLDTDDIESDLKASDIEGVVQTTGIGNRSEIKILDCSTNSWDRQYQLDDTSGNVPEDGDNGNIPVEEIFPKNAAQFIGEKSTLREVAGAKRYIGGNPDNYIDFNDENWRIIGVYGDSLKIIRSNRLLNGMLYNSSSYNNKWANSSLNKYLNKTSSGGYYYSLTNTAKLMIVSGTWNVGASNINNTASQAYSNESSLTWNGKVGLIATYEFLYATSADDCDEIAGSNFGTSYHSSRSCNCGIKDYNWLNLDMAWSINPNSADSTRSLLIHEFGVVDTYTIDTGYMDIYPVVYLNKDVMIVGGTGKSDDPYQLSL